MNLELKNLSPYLPYGLKAIYNEENEENTVVTILGTCILDKERHYQIKFKDGIVGLFIANDIKPILRPLSDLTKISDEVLINEHTINILLQEKHNQEYGIFSHYKGQLDIELDGEPDLRYDSNKSISFFTILTIQEQLLKGHYDIFGLIEKGLAIDINTLK
jgi:hypothetical protein